MPSLTPPKPHKSHKELVEILENRGMIIPDKNRAERKLSQIGYYRLSGFWYPCREFKNASNGDIRKDSFQKDINFNDIIRLYLFDKNLRLLMIDAIERIEIYIRSIIAHELGQYDPLAYKSINFINPQKLHFRDKNKNIRNLWEEWSQNHSEKIKYSREDCIVHHKSNSKAMPFWVVIEAWDFGTMSKYFENLKINYQYKICKKLDIPKPYILRQWLHEINILRNRCAHHSRIWNQSFRNPLPTIDNPYFNALDLDKRALKRMYGMICILWFLVKKIGPKSDWLNSTKELINAKPSINSCPNTAMGFPDNSGFPKF
ncbi:Abi family protein [Desulfobacula phenolica]|uniref:Abortive infection bacteriophage resistance protein n=1 Tax=Desulfobacula phenolica TaxID=90732 RepID=A0A1H2I307_9BACT|nr:Abi family protein [Desulfobacula phenolica]SDU38449.1 Abortive infection bacteriophage resistance protein [Desulfobacula phenolica]